MKEYFENINFGEKISTDEKIMQNFPESTLVFSLDVYIIRKLHFFHHVSILQRNQLWFDSSFHGTK